MYICMYIYVHVHVSGLVVTGRWRKGNCKDKNLGHVSAFYVFEHPSVELFLSLVYEVDF